MSIRTSANTEQFDEAFAKAQAKFEAAAKSSTNPAYRSKYADISAVIEATLEHLNSEGIGVRQHPSFEYKGEVAFITITTRLSHKGQWEESELSLPARERERFDAQSCGSAVTYGCRYALQGIFCVRREDDDGNLATGRGSREAAQTIAQQKLTEYKEIQKQEALFYTHPENQNGHAVEFLNYDAYLLANEEKKESVDYAFSVFGAKRNKTRRVFVQTEKLAGLLEKLAGDCGVTVKEQVSH